MRLKSLENNGNYRFSCQGTALPELSGGLPSYRLHKNSATPLVTLNGTDHYLGHMAVNTATVNEDALHCAIIRALRDYRKNQRLTYALHWPTFAPSWL